MGSYRMPCPICGKTLDVPLHLNSTHSNLWVTVDHLYLRRHWLTHNQHPGEPLGMAA